MSAPVPKWSFSKKDLLKIDMKSLVDGRFTIVLDHRSKIYVASEMRGGLYSSALYLTRTGERTVCLASISKEQYETKAVGYVMARVIKNADAYVGHRGHVHTGYEGERGAVRTDVYLAYPDNMFRKTTHSHAVTIESDDFERAAKNADAVCQAISDAIKNSAIEFTKNNLIYIEDALEEKKPGFLKRILGIFGI